MFFKDYDISGHNHPCNTNAIEDAFSGLSMDIVTQVEEEMKELAKYVHRLAP